MKRFRTWFVILAPLLVVATMFALDPDGGLRIKVASPTTTVLLLNYLRGLLLVSGSFAIVKILFDYPEADTRALFAAASRGSVSNALALIARMLMFGFVMFALSKAAYGADVRTYIPAQAHTYAPMLQTEQVRFWATHPAPEMLAGLVEQESCLSLTHSRCWNPASRLKTAREEGAGMGQITRAYRKDGSERFDALAEMRSAHRELADLTWTNVYTSPALQLRAVVFKVRDDFKALVMISDPRLRLDFVDGSYNAGRGRIADRRRACGLKRDCDPQVWFGNVERVCLTGVNPLYGKRTACDIVQEHVQMVSRVRSAKYRGMMS